MIPHLHRNPVNPTLFRQVEHLFGCVAEGDGTAAVTAAGTVISLAASGKVKAGGERGAVEEEAAESDFSTADLAEEACSSLRRRSL